MADYSGSNHPGVGTLAVVILLIFLNQGTDAYC